MEPRRASNDEIHEGIRLRPLLPREAQQRRPLTDRITLAPETFTLDSVQPETVDWLWSHRIPLGKLTILAGDPGCGKSYLSMAIGAAVSRGRALPAQNSITFKPYSVLMLNPEDGLGDTIRQRADICDADLTRFILPKAGTIRDARALDQILESNTEIRLVIVDPIVSLLHGKNENRNGDVRAALDPFVDVAHRRRVAILGIQHLRKAEALQAIYKLGGSVGGFVGLARSVLAVSVTDIDAGRRAVVAIKHNLARPSRAIAFTIDDQGFKWGDETDEVDEVSVFTNVASSNQQRPRERAKELLVEILRNGPQASPEVYARAAESGINRKTLDRAATELGVGRQQRGFHGGWEMSLPKPPEKLPPPPA